MGVPICITMVIVLTASPQAMEDLELGRSLDKERLKTPTYAEVLTLVLL